MLKAIFPNTSLVRKLSAHFGLLSLVLIFSYPAQVRGQSQPTCIDPLGRAVLYVADYSVDDIAIAGTFANGWPGVRWNPNVVAAARPVVVDFFYYHECAHHVLGHVLNRVNGPGTEASADCWAKRVMFELEVLDETRYRSLLSELLVGSKPTVDFADGRARVDLIVAC